MMRDNLVSRYIFARGYDQYLALCNITAISRAVPCYENSAKDVIYSHSMVLGGLLEMS